jgi:ribosomal protein S18 acetylase RimI-like enzyme
MAEGGTEPRAKPRGYVAVFLRETPVGRLRLARIYCKRSNWLKPILGTGQNRRAVIRRRLALDRVITVSDGRETVAILGFWMDGRGATEIRAADLFDRAAIWSSLLRILLFRVATSHLKRGEVYVESLWVKPSHRRLGLAHRLIERLEGRAREARQSRIRLYVDPANDVAVALYRSCGFAETQRFNLPVVGRVLGYERLAVLEKPLPVAPATAQRKIERPA